MAGNLNRISAHRRLFCRYVETSLTAVAHHSEWCVHTPVVASTIVYSALILIYKQAKYDTYS